MIWRWDSIKGRTEEEEEEGGVKGEAASLPKAILRLKQLPLGPSVSDQPEAAHTETKELQAVKHHSLREWQGDKATTRAHAHTLAHARRQLE